MRRRMKVAELKKRNVFKMKKEKEHVVHELKEKESVEFERHTTRKGGDRVKALSLEL